MTRHLFCEESRVWRSSSFMEIKFKSHDWRSGPACAQSNRPFEPHHHARKSHQILTTDIRTLPIHIKVRQSFVLDNRLFPYRYVASKQHPPSFRPPSSQACRRNRVSSEQGFVHPLHSHGCQHNVLLRTGLDRRSRERLPEEAPSLRSSQASSQRRRQTHLSAISGNSQSIQFHRRTRAPDAPRGIAARSTAHARFISSRLWTQLSAVRHATFQSIPATTTNLVRSRGRRSRRCLGLLVAS